MMSGKVIIYEHNHGSDDDDDGLFEYSETLTDPSYEISYLSFSSGDMLAVSENGDNVFIYDDTGSFTLIQTIPINGTILINGTAICRGIITEAKDKTFLTISYDMTVSLYMFVSNQFQE